MQSGEVSPDKHAAWPCFGNTDNAAIGSMIFFIAFLRVVDVPLSLPPPISSIRFSTSFDKKGTIERSNVFEDDGDGDGNDGNDDDDLPFALRFF